LNSPIIIYASENEALREREFLLRAPAKDVLIGSVSSDEVLVQGTIDMLIIGPKNVIVDYKRTGIKEEKEIIARYGMQLNLYALAAERIMGIKIHRKVIYLIGRNKEIEVE
jgi:ATP-dependent helicase/nuclease subunit A